MQIIDEILIITFILCPSTCVVLFELFLLGVPDLLLLYLEIKDFRGRF